MAFRLSHSEKPAEGLVRIVLGQMDRSRTALLKARGQPTDALVHKVRQRLKKCRAVLRLLRRGAAESGVRRCGRLLRDAGRALSTARDARVALRTFDRLIGQEAVTGDLAALRRALLRNATWHEEAGRPARSAAALIGEAAALLAALRPIRGEKQALMTGLQRLYQRARKSARCYQAAPTGVSLHEWRKRTKDLYYCLLVARTHCKPGIQKDLERLRQLGAVMGRRLDIDVLLRVAPACRRKPIPAALAKAAAADQRKFDHRIQTAVETVFGASPKRFGAALQEKR